MPSAKIEEYMITAQACTCPTRLVLEYYRHTYDENSNLITGHVDENGNMIYDENDKIQRTRPRLVNPLHTDWIKILISMYWYDYVSLLSFVSSVGLLGCVFLGLTVLISVSSGPKIRLAAGHADEGTTAQFFAAASATGVSQNIVVEGAGSQGASTCNVLAGRHDFGELENLPCAALVKEVSPCAGIVDSGCGFAGCMLGVDISTGTLKITATNAPEDAGNPQFGGAGAHIRLSDYHIEHCAKLTNRAQNSLYAAFSIALFFVIELLLFMVMVETLKHSQRHHWVRVMEQGTSTNAAAAAAAFYASSGGMLTATFIPLVLAAVYGVTELADTILQLGFEVVDTFVCVPREHLKDEPTYYVRVASESARDSWVFHLATISSGGLVGVRCELLAEYSRKTGLDALELDAIKKMTAEERCAVIDMAGVRYPDIGPATHFLSHTWGQPIAEKIDAIEAQERQANLRAATLASELNLLVRLD